MISKSSSLEVTPAELDTTTRKTNGESYERCIDGFRVNIL
jgi:hypothetical protein